MLPLLILLPLLPPAAMAGSAAGEAGAPVDLHFFWSLSCPHCRNAHPFIANLPVALPWLRLHEHEISRDRAAAERFRALVEKAGAGDIAGVPAFYFCGELHFGWESEASTGELLRRRLTACHERGLTVVPGDNAAPGAGMNEVELPFVGRVDAASLSLPVLTIVLAALDAFNPCAFFVLLFLLSMMAHQKSRGRMLAIGAVFVLISGLMYFAFMAAWLNVFQLIGHLAAVTLAAGALAVLIGLLNVKDFFLFKQGPSLSISDARRGDIARRARAILAAEHLPAMLLATVVLAVAANFYELLCTAGFPMVFTRLLTLNEPSLAARYGWLALYNLIYVLPLAAIVVLFARTLGARRLSEREGRLLKLLSGLMMLGLGLLLLFVPERIDQPAIALGLMLAAVLLTALAARCTRPAPPR